MRPRRGALAALIVVGVFSARAVAAPIGGPVLYPRSTAPEVTPLVAAPPPPPPPELALGALQLAVGYGAEIGGLAGAVALGLTPKELGHPSDLGAMAFVGMLAPALAGGAVCGAGLLSRTYHGRCSTTVLGAYLGAAAGMLLGMAVAPNAHSDDTTDFVLAVFGVGGILAMAPIGAVIGYHTGKETW